MAKKNKTEALVIVHLSSLDAYTQMGIEAEGDDATGEDKAFWIERAIMLHKGPVYIIDQGWETGRRESRPRESLLNAVRFRKDIVWIKFDEAEDDWEPFLRDLEARLKKDGVTHVVVGGIWYEPSLESGCASAVYVHLRKQFKTRVDPDIVGCEDDFQWPEEDEDEEDDEPGAGGGLFPILPLGPA